MYFSSKTLPLKYHGNATMSCIGIAELQGTVNNIVCTWCLHVKCSIFLFDFNKLAFSRQSVIKVSDPKLNKNPPSGS